ncbi:MAG TPA: 30S ribosomal protein S16 [Pirellulales bacterium]|nr:30S ribosomal protein S16 [Pirellulales bacterium]
MSVKIRMKKMGRKHRPFFRICATDSRSPRDGKVLEELGTYDPMIADTDARVTLNNERLKYWLSVGAQPSDNVKVFIKKYGPEGIRVDAQQAARERLAMPKEVPPAPEPVYVPPPKGAAATAAEAPAEATGETASEPEAAAEPAPATAEEGAASEPAAE